MRVVHAFPRRRWPWAVLAVLLVVLVAGGAWWLGARRDASEVSAAESVGAFRARTAGVGDPARGVPVPGVYTYAQRGRETGGIGPISVGRDLPATARFTVSEAGPDGYLGELALADQHLEAVRYAVADGWVRSVWRRTDITLAGVGRDDRRDLVPPPRWMPLRPRVGREWVDRYEAGPLPVVARTRITGRDTVEVDGRPLPVLVVRIGSDTGEPYPGTRTETLWWSEDLALALRWRIVDDIRGLARLDLTTDLTLTSTAPER